MSHNALCPLSKFRGDSFRILSSPHSRSFSFHHFPLNNRKTKAITRKLIYFNERESLYNARASLGIVFSLDDSFLVQIYRAMKSWAHKKHFEWFLSFCCNFFFFNIHKCVATISFGDFAHKEMSNHKCWGGAENASIK